MTWPISLEEGQLLVPRPDAAARRQPREQLLLAHAPDPARDALPARLVAEELGDPPERVDEVDRLVEDHDHARAERRPGGARRLEGQRQVERLRPDEDAGRAAQQDRLDRRGRRGRRPRARSGRAASPRTRPRRSPAARRGRTGRRASGRSSPRCRSPRTPRRRSRGSAGCWPASRRCSRPSACRRAPPRPGTAACCAARRACPRSTRRARSPRRRCRRPAPRRSSMSKAKPEPRMSGPSRPAARAASMAVETRAAASGYSPRRYR